MFQSLAGKMDGLAFKNSLIRVETAYIKKGLTAMANPINLKHH